MSLPNDKRIQRLKEQTAANELAHQIEQLKQRKAELEVKSLAQRVTQRLHQADSFEEVLGNIIRALNCPDRQDITQVQIDFWTRAFDAIKENKR